MAGLIDTYRAWRHSRGFGVHSPFAYRLIRDALRPPRGYAYYADFYPDLDPAFDQTQDSGDDSLFIKPRILLRVALYLRRTLFEPNSIPLLACVPSASHYAGHSAGLCDSLANALRFAGFKFVNSTMKSGFFFINDPNNHIPGSPLWGSAVIIFGNALTELRSPTKPSADSFAGRVIADMERRSAGLAIYAHSYTLLILNPDMALTEYAIL